MVKRCSNPGNVRYKGPDALFCQGMHFFRQMVKNPKVLRSASQVVKGRASKGSRTATSVLVPGRKASLDTSIRRGNKSLTRAEEAKAKRNRLLQVELPLANPSRRSLRRRVGHTQLRAVHCGLRGGKVKSPVKAQTPRRRRRNAWFQQAIVRRIPHARRGKTLEDEWTVVTTEPGPLIAQCCSLPLYGGLSPFNMRQQCYCGKRFSEVSWDHSEPLIRFDTVLVCSWVPFKWKRVCRYARRQFSKWKRAAFIVLMPHWRGRAPRPGVLRKILLSVRSIPTRREKRRLAAAGLGLRDTRKRSGKGAKLRLTSSPKYRRKLLKWLGWKRK